MSATAAADQRLALRIQPEPVERFRLALRRLAGNDDAPVGIAVSGGPDSLALLLLAGAACPGTVRAATVNHGLRPGSNEEAKMVAGLCAQIGVPHQILTVEWAKTPATAIQERARDERYRLLGEWAQREGLKVVLVAHHADDQAETLLMRLARGAGIKGLASMRPCAPLPGRPKIKLLRPLLDWRRSELQKICDQAQIHPVEDPSNVNEQFERVRIRRFLADAPWLDPAALARSATVLSEADAALDWAADRLWQKTVVCAASEILLTDPDVPPELLRRLTARAIAKLASEGSGVVLRGRELGEVLRTLRSGGQSSLRGVLCSGGAQWRFVPAPKRTRPVDNCC